MPAARSAIGVSMKNASMREITSTRGLAEIFCNTWITASGFFCQLHRAGICQILAPTRQRESDDGGDTPGQQDDRNRDGYGDQCAGRTAAVVLVVATGRRACAPAAGVTGARGVAAPWFFGNADQLVGFRLMPIETAMPTPLQARWTHLVIDSSARLVAFKDQSLGNVTGWKWEFGDGGTSTEQNPQHIYTRGGDFVVTLEVEGPAGTSRFQRVWDVSVR